MTRHLLFLFCFLCTLFPLSAQFNWERLSGLDGGFILDLEKGTDYVFGAYNAGVVRTSDGENWTPVFDGDIVEISVFDNMVLAQRRVGIVFEPGTYHELYRSDDAGETWTQIIHPAPERRLYFVAVNNNTILAANSWDDELYRSEDQGQTWTPQSLGSYSVYNFEVLSDRILMSGPDELLVSFDEGQSWSDITPDLAAQQSIRGVHINMDTWYVCTSEGLLMSTNQGLNWSVLHPELGFFDMTSTNDHLFFTILGDSIGFSAQYSEDNGSTLLDVGNSNQLDFMTGLISFDEKILLSAGYRSMFRWDATQNWLTRSAAGLDAPRVSLLKAHDNRIWAVADKVNIAAYGPLSQSWININNESEENELTHLAIKSVDTILLHWRWTFMAKITSDGGGSWNTIDYLDLEPGSQLALNRWMGFLDDRLYVLSSSINEKTWYSDDLLNTIQESSVELTANIINFQGAAYSATEADIVQLSDGGNVITPVNSDLDLSAYYLFSAHDQLMMAFAAPPPGYGYEVRLSYDGLHWFVPNGLPDLEIYDFDDIDHTAQNFLAYVDNRYYIYLYNHGLYVSLDEGENWLPADPIREEYLAADDHHFYLGNYLGVFRSHAPQQFGDIYRGRVFVDNNQNGSYDAGEPGLSNIRVGVEQAINGTDYFYFSTTDSSGQYELGIFPNTVTDTFRVISNVSANIVSTPAYHTTGAGGGDGFDFGLAPEDFPADLAVSGYSFGSKRPGKTYFLKVNTENLGLNVASADVRVVLDEQLNYLSNQGAPVFVNEDTLLFSVSPNALSTNQLWIQTRIDTTAMLDDVLTSTIELMPNGADAVAANNNFTISDIVVAAYDPNNKEVTPADGQTLEEINNREDIRFTINFQNVGTAPADRVRITDQLDTALYLPPLQFLDASHPVSSFNLRPGGVLEVIFDDINLIDSTTNEAASHGFVVFSVQRKLPYNELVPVKNQAAIYFDYNPPIITNEVELGIRMPDGTNGGPTIRQELACEVYPNPARDQVMIQLHGVYAQEAATLSVFDAFGKMMGEPIQFSGQEPFVWSHDLPAGAYWIQIRTADAQANKLLVIHR